MTSDDLTLDQIDKIRESLSPGIRYLAKFIERMERAWPANVPLLTTAYKASDAALSLSQGLHYRDCPGVGQRAK